MEPLLIEVVACVGGRSQATTSFDKVPRTVYSIYRYYKCTDHWNAKIRGDLTDCGGRHEVAIAEDEG